MFKVWQRYTRLCTSLVSVLLPQFLSYPVFLRLICSTVDTGWYDRYARQSVPLMTSVFQLFFLLFSFLLLLCFLFSFSLFSYLLQTVWCAGLHPFFCWVFLSVHDMAKSPCGVYNVTIQSVVLTADIFHFFSQNAMQAMSNGYDIYLVVCDHRYRLCSTSRHRRIADRLIGPDTGCARCIWVER